MAKTYKNKKNDPPPRFNTSRRSKAQTARDTRRVSEMYLAGALQADIAYELKISQATVSRTLAKLQEAWVERAVDNRGNQIAQELAKVDNLELEYWRSWRASGEPIHEKTIEQIRFPGKQNPSQEEQKPTKLTTKSAEKTTDRVGDPQYLKGIQWCIERRCQILGLDAPKRADFTTGGRELVPGAAVIYLPDNNRAQNPPMEPTEEPGEPEPTEPGEPAPMEPTEEPGEPLEPAPL